MKTLTIILNETQLDFVRRLVEDARDGVKDRLKPIGDPVAALAFDPILEAINNASDRVIFTFDLAESPDQHVETWIRVPDLEESPEPKAEVVQAEEPVSSPIRQVQTAVVEIKSDQNVEPVGEGGVSRPQAPSGSYGNASQWLKDVQAECDFTNSAMADRLDIGTSTYTFWKSGKKAPLGWRGCIEHFCKLTGIAVPQLDRPLPGPIAGMPKTEPAPKSNVIKASFPTKVPEPEIAPIDLDELLKTDWKFVPPTQTDEQVSVTFASVMQVVTAAAQSSSTQDIYDRCTSLGSPRTIPSILASFAGPIEVMRQIKGSGLPPYKQNELVQSLNDMVKAVFPDKGLYLEIKAVKG